MEKQFYYQILNRKFYQQLNKTLDHSYYSKSLVIFAFIEKKPSKTNDLGLINCFLKETILSRLSGLENSDLSMPKNNCWKYTKFQY